MKLKTLMMTLDNTAVIKGSDISYWQGDVDFVQMYKAGIRFVIIRAGYGTTIDKHFVTYINAAIAAGLMVGVYWFIYARNPAEAKNNAKKCMEVIAPYREQIICRVWVDYEYDSDRYAGYMSNAKRSSLVRTFLTQLQTEGYEVGIYTNQDYIQSGKFSDSLIKEYSLWFAKYSSTMSKYAERGKDGHPLIWQHTSSGDGDKYGVSSRCIDLNRGYFRIEEKPNAETVLDKVQTDNTIIKASDNPYPEPQRVLQYRNRRYMQSGDDVKWSQWNFWRCGLYLDGNGVPDATQIDGLFGPDSADAAEEARRRLGLPPGRMVDQALIDALKII